MMRAVIKAMSGNARRAEAITRLRLQAARFRKMLDNARSLLALMADGREKRAGEYIFDKQYVMSLVDNLLERAGMLVLDACALVPRGGETLLSGFDRQKGYAGREFFAAEIVSEPEAAVEPELALLSQVLAWCEESTDVRREPLMGLVRQAFDHVFESSNRDGDPWPGLLDDSPSIHRTDGLRLLVIPEFGDGSASALAPNRPLPPCRPFGALLPIGPDGAGGRARSGAAATRWLAVMSEERLLLRGLSDGRQTWVAAAMTGRVQSDFAFAFLPRGLNPDELKAEQLHLDETSLGTMAWCERAPTEVLERCLAALGRTVFGVA